MPLIDLARRPGDLEGILAADGMASRIENDPPLVRLVGYHDPMLDLTRGHEKDPVRLAEEVCIVQG